MKNLLIKLAVFLLKRLEKDRVKIFVQSFGGRTGLNCVDFNDKEGKLLSRYSWEEAAIVICEELLAENKKSQEHRKYAEAWSAGIDYAIKTYALDEENTKILSKVIDRELDRDKSNVRYKNFT
jgi:hypothetical protein